jgi:hypothetical protein
MKMRSLPQCTIVPGRVPVLLIKRVTSIDMADVFRDIAKRCRGPLTDSEWSALGVWRHAAEHPVAKILKGCRNAVPGGDGEGTGTSDTGLSDPITPPLCATFRAPPAQPVQGQFPSSQLRHAAGIRAFHLDWVF